MRERGSKEGGQIQIVKREGRGMACGREERTGGGQEQMRKSKMSARLSCGQIKVFTQAFDCPVMSSMTG